MKPASPSPPLLPLGNARAPEALKLASQLCSMLAQEPQSPGTACQPGLLRRHHPTLVMGLAQADTGRAAGQPSPFLCSLSLGKDQCTKQLKAAGRKKRRSSLAEPGQGVKAAQERHSPIRHSSLPAPSPAQANSTFPISPTPGTCSSLHVQGLPKAQWCFR